MNILLISKSEKPCLTSFPVQNISFLFVFTASCNVYYNFQDCIDIALFRILYVIEYLFHLKTDCACLIDIKKNKNKKSLSE